VLSIAIMRYTCGGIFVRLMLMLMLVLVLMLVLRFISVSPRCDHVSSLSTLSLSAFVSCVLNLNYKIIWSAKFKVSQISSPSNKGIRGGPRSLLSVALESSGVGSTINLVPRDTAGCTDRFQQE
jgi:hypothetical protein